MVVLKQFLAVYFQNYGNVEVKLLIHVEKDVQHVAGMGDIDFFILHYHHFLREGIQVEIALEQIYDGFFGWG